jgi:hypothetical protein
MNDYARWYSTSQAARRARISSQHMQNLGDAGKVRAVRTALGRLFDPDDIERLAQEREARQRAKEAKDAVAG